MADEVGEETESGDESERADASRGDRGAEAFPSVVDAPSEVAEPLARALDSDGPRVIDRSALDRLEGVRRALHRAENRARQIVERARRDAEEIRERARDEGRQQGYEELVSLIAETRERYRRIQDEAEEDTLELAFRIARRLIGRELERDPSVVRDIVDQALERVRGKRRVVIRAHPDDVDQLEGHGDEWSEQLDGAAIDVEGDASIDRGGCILETETSRVDARLDVQLDRIREILESPEGPR